MDDTHMALRLAVAVGLGVLLGLEREHTKGGEGGVGVRTFALIALAGALAGMLDTLGLGGAWALALFAALSVLVVAEYWRTSTGLATGITTEVSALLAFVLGLLCAHGWLQLAAAAAVIVALLLAIKPWLHGLASRINGADVQAALKFAIVTLIILPLVPNQTWGPPPLDALNPYKLWLMVVLISALNFVSYLVIKVLGSEHGIGLVGLLGGLASSTALTLGFARRSRTNEAEIPMLALGIVLAWTVMVARVVVMAAVISPRLGGQLALALAPLALTSLAACLWLWRRGRGPARGQVQAVANPFELTEAVQFGLLYGVVVVIARAAQVYLGDSGVLLAAAAAGLTDVDAITLAMADWTQAETGRLSLAAQAVVVAILANTLTKTGMAAVLGTPALRYRLLPTATVLVVAGAMGFWLGA